jgi:hypothetical protein
MPREVLCRRPVGDSRGPWVIALSEHDNGMDMAPRSSLDRARPTPISRTNESHQFLVPAKGSAIRSAGNRDRDLFQLNNLLIAEFLFSSRPRAVSSLTWLPPIFFRNGHLNPFAPGHRPLKCCDRWFGRNGTQN